MSTIRDALRYAHSGSGATALVPEPGAARRISAVPKLQRRHVRRRDTPVDEEGGRRDEARIVAREDGDGGGSSGSARRPSGTCTSRRAARDDGTEDDPRREAGIRRLTRVTVARRVTANPACH